MPNVVIFATGGTIAGSSSSNTDTTGYQAGVVGVAALVQGEPPLDAALERDELKPLISAAVPELLGIANVVGSQISNIGSQDSESVCHHS